MVRIAKDTPRYILDMLVAVDFSRITTENYVEWTKIIKEHIGKYVKKRKVPADLMEMNIPLRQDFLDMINGYDLSSLSKAKKIAVVPLAKQWANKNLPLKHKLN